jgi:nucleoside 2-deoxyribosyltransferase
MRVYISGPITGISNYREIFALAAERLAERDLQPVNPAELVAVTGGAFTYDETMHLCLEALSRCEALALLPGWEESHGACVEYGFATALNLPVVTVEDLVNGRNV